MNFTPSKLNLFTFFKLPMVWWSGIRVVVFEKNYCEVNVRHRWINQNPFKSMFWAVQGMAAELTTGVLLMHEIQISKQKISMLVLNNKANFSKKARGRILFSCAPEDKIAKAIEQLIKTKEPQTLWLISKGVDENQDVVSTFEFEWTLLLKK
ncbi:DUF4442 domain-containing protein [Flavobacteriaceae bacterium]|nr:DUF4442 domain-containing protein [Flavobacteriaceae bacterium]MDB2695431.1 DUF4442 domain-containing protein [Flavobacteriaceae bacterium]MDC1542194.1 DUF4442 domain-containing protein [Flavobacteriaceae bacterium]MDC3214946.1 DUF4442 domain-containing protein [Flavobacteriaceae bacterium]MDC3218828.1 DUF4442 domain-containing protein [Flavobacteriaceae bacterium]